MMKKVFVGIVASFVTVTVLGHVMAGQGKGRGSGPVIYVTTQQMFYDSIVTADPVPNKGPFQKLEMGGPSSFNLQTEFGPGQPGYIGGRWWIDLDGDMERDDDDKYFVCPLLPPGREEE